jgi:ABC-type histidine transport system ATPase subunit
VSGAIIEIADLLKSYGALPVLRGGSPQVDRSPVVVIIGAERPENSRTRAFLARFHRFMGSFPGPG